MADSQPISWPDLAIGLYDRLTGRQAEISYEFENLHVNSVTAITVVVVKAPKKLSHNIMV